MTRPRKVDYEQARALRKGGATYTDIARIFDVTPTAIARICDERVAIAMSAIIARRQTSGTCPDCGAPTSFNPSSRQKRGLSDTNGSNRCRSCYIKRAATSVRPTTLQCCLCRLWLDDEEFTSVKDRPSRRYRASACRKCNAMAKVHARLRLCAECGATCQGERCRSCAARARGRRGHAVRYGWNTEVNS